jgi:hypothetical protein
MLTLRHKLEIAGALLALVAIASVGGSWLGAREEGIRLKATLDAQGQVIASAQKQAKDIQAAEAERDKETAATVAAFQQAAAKQVTPEQIAAWIPKQLSTPQPITFTIPPATPQNPTPNATASIPAADLPALRDQITACQTCSVKLSTAQADLSSRDQRLTLAGQQLSALTKERDAAVTAAKGGGKWQRIKRAAKWFGIGAALGYAASKAGH